MEIVDNINILFGDSLKNALKPGARLKIAASSFSMYTYEALRENLEHIDSLEFVFTSPTFTAEKATDRINKEHREFFIPKLNRERSLYGSEFEVKLRNQLTQRALAKDCASWMRRKATFRSNKSKDPMQQFACVLHPDGNTVYLPLHGFTAVDLGYQKGDAVSNYITKFEEGEGTQKYSDLFDQIWSSEDKVVNVTDTVIDHMDSVYRENPPELIYFLTLYNIFNEFLENLDEDVLPNDRTGYQDSLIWEKLFNFQRDAATGIINKLEHYNGCILADSVGLGKTFTALAVIKYYELRNKSVLVLCPKKLAENWLNYNTNVVTNQFSEDRFSYDVLCHTDLQRDKGMSLNIDLSLINWGNYDLVVIDESHNFRNNETFKGRETRYERLMKRIIQDGVETKVMMLSATPVNNRFTDLRNQLALAYEGDSEKFHSKLKVGRSVDEIFKRAQASFNMWSKLPPEERTPDAILKTLDFDFFELLDNVTIARSRKHIETFYDTSEIGKFPKRLFPIPIHPPLTHRSDIFDYNAIYEELRKLNLAVYAPINYLLDSRIAKYAEIYDTEVASGGGKLRQADRERSLQALMTVNLLKRLESSVYSFRITLNKLRDNNLSNLERIERYEKTGKDGSVNDQSSYYENLDPDADDWPDPNDDEVTGKKVVVRLEDMNLPEWKRDLEADLKVIDELLAEMEKITPEHDAKLQDLKTLIETKLASPINSGNKKIIIFTAFSDTAHYLYENIASEHLSKHQLHTGIVTGDSTPHCTLGKGYDYQKLLCLFSPISKHKQEIFPDEDAELDLLIGTDCISEGQNLQDCDYLINYDIHWNPVRIIQRFGRIDRIGSKNDVIQLVNYWPDISLDEYINLRERVENRMIIADVTATGDDNPLRAKANDLSYRKEQLRRLQEEVIDMEDLKTGVAITDLGLNDFRMDLLNYLKSERDLSRVPNGMHSVVPADLERGLKSGVIYTLRNRNHGVNIHQQNRLHPYYLVYMGLDGEVLVRHTDVKRLLDLTRAACKGKDQPLQEIAKIFNETTKDGRRMETYSDLLTQAIQSMIEVKEEDDVESLFTGSQTTALRDTISGLDDFELITFLIIHPTTMTSASDFKDLIETTETGILRLKKRGVRVTSELVYKLMEENEDRSSS
ncbi:MAG: helicase-related protein [Verrucomicrobiota bacterium]